MLSISLWVKGRPIIFSDALTMPASIDCPFTKELIKRQEINRDNTLLIVIVLIWIVSIVG
jgi:hypothetical protein